MPLLSFFAISRFGVEGTFSSLHSSSIPLRLAILAASLLPLAEVGAAAPPNDNFANRVALTTGVTAVVNTADSTVEPGEPNASQNFSAHRSVWYTWTATADSVISIDNIGSQTYYQYITVYMGNSVDKLTAIYHTEFNGSPSTLRIPLTVKAGTTFQIVVGDHSSNNGGNVQLTLSANPFSHAGPLFGPGVPNSTTPLNDNFENKSILSGDTFTVLGYNRAATIQGGEPNKPYTNVSRTLWYQWTAPADSEVTIDTTGTTIDGHYFAVYAGNTISTVAPVSGDYSSSTNAANATFFARGGVTYVIAAGTRSSGDYGTLVLTFTSAPPLAGSLLNLSTRMAVGTGNNVLIGGFIITGGPKQLLIRAIGPSLTQSRVANAMADPTLELHAGDGTLIAGNNDWQDDPTQATAIQNTGLAPKDAHESALLVTLDPGNYTAILGGLNNTTGVGLVEVYDTGGAGAAAKAVNVSTRGFVSTGDSVMIGGFIVGGSSAANVIIRGIGPSLANSGIVNALQNPVVNLYDGNGTKQATVSNWQDFASYGQVIAAGLAPTDSRESALQAVFQPGNYTAILSGSNNTSGVGLIEIYNLAPQ